MPKTRKLMAALVAFAISIPMAGLVAPPAVAAPVGEGFTVTASDLSYILKQIKVAEAHVANTTTATGPCGALLGTGANQLASPLLSFGLRTVDGSCNNLVPGQETHGAADVVFPRLATPVFSAAESNPPSVRAAEPLVVRGQDTGQHGVRQPTPGDQQLDRRPDLHQPGSHRGSRVPRTHSGQYRCGAVHDRPGPARRPTRRACTPGLHSVARDAVHPQRDHRRGPVAALQLVVHAVRSVLRPRARPEYKGGGTVFVPLQRRRPADRRRLRRGDADDLPPTAFMVLTRAANQPGPDGVVGDDPAPPSTRARTTYRSTRTRHTVGRPEPDLHLAPLAPGVPARVPTSTAGCRSPPGGCSAAHCRSMGSAT